MLPPILLEPKEKKDILDMTAAPGGKTTEIAALTNNKAYITACEKNKVRADRLLHPCIWILAVQHKKMSVY